MSYRSGERLQQPQSPISHQTRYDSEFQSERSSISLRSHFDLVEPAIRLPLTSKALQEISFTACPSSRSSEKSCSESDVTEKPHTQSIKSLGIRKIDSWKPPDSHTNSKDNISSVGSQFEIFKPSEAPGEDNLRCTTQSQEKYAKGREVFFPADKQDYISQWKSSFPSQIPPKFHHDRQCHSSDDTLIGRGNDLQSEIVDLKDQIGYMKRFISLLVSSPSYTSIVRCPSRLCGLFSPSPQFFSALAELSFVIGTRKSFEWVHDPSLLDEAISRCLTILLRIYDDTYSLLEGEGLEGRGRRMELIRPPDVLWILVHTCDHHILDSLERVLEIIKISTKRMTQRWIILTILLYTIRSDDQIDENHYHSRRRRARDGEGFKGWAKRQALLFARNFWTLDDCPVHSKITRNRTGENLGWYQHGIVEYDDHEDRKDMKRISADEIRRIINEARLGDDNGRYSDRKTNKRKLITYEDLYAVESDIFEKSEDGDNHTNKRVRR
ncbi:uncharacterized protein L199_005888 [Kwoniella botswanensis]|uniref:uncharacterized protein n=1 Tax=Kwoniella botswanensis TaxID=1268659 RepID=UPI00315D9498